MAERVPDLWRLNEDASRLYQLVLGRLQIHDMHERVVAVSRQVRRYAARGPGSEEGLFTFSFEIHSLCELGKYQAAWRQLRRREEIIFGKRFDLVHRHWTANDGAELACSYAPLLYFLGRYRQGCSLLEISLDFWFKRRKAPSYELLFRVYNGDNEPRNIYRVTLSHFYERLGKGLSEWQHWGTFVSGFHPRLLTLSGFRRNELLANPGYLPVFFDRLMTVRRERMTSGISGGQSDLIESAAKVGKRQQAKQQELDDFKAWIKPVEERTNRKLQELFPELRGLPK